MSKSKINWGKTGLFAAGVAFGTAGIKLLSSKDAKKLYTNCTAAVLRAMDCVMYQQFRRTAATSTRMQRALTRTEQLRRRQFTRILPMISLRLRTKRK